jgi:hypothetical protein
MCCECNGKDHPASHCTKKSDKSDKDNNAASTASTVNKLKKDIKKMSKASTAVNAKLEQLKEAEFDLSGSDAEEESSYFNVMTLFNSLRLSLSLNQESLSFSKAHGTKINVDLKQAMLLDSQSTMGLFCNKALVDKIHKSSNTMRLKSDGGSMLVCQKATMPGYKNKVWFSAEAITNVIALREFNKTRSLTMAMT